MREKVDVLFLISFFRVFSGSEIIGGRLARIVSTLLIKKLFIILDILEGDVSI